MYHLSIPGHQRTDSCSEVSWSLKNIDLSGPGSSVGEVVGECVAVGDSVVIGDSVSVSAKSFLCVPLVDATGLSISEPPASVPVRQTGS